MLKPSALGVSASYTDLSIGPAGVWTLIFSAVGLGNAISSPFSNSPGPPIVLSIVVQPSGAYGGSHFAAYPVVAVLDAGGNLANTTLSRFSIVPYLYQIPSGITQAVLNGSNVTVEDGLSTFSDLSINIAGSGYILGFKLIAWGRSSISLPDAVTQPFDVQRGAAATFQIHMQPASIAVAGYPLPTQPSIFILDRGGNAANSSLHVQVLHKHLTC